MVAKKLRPGKTGHTTRRKEKWTLESVVDALFAFHKSRKRWPQHWEYRSMNGLPSRWKLVRLVNPTYYAPYESPFSPLLLPQEPVTTREFIGWRRPWDFLQIAIAKDDRCTTELVFTLPNALARKEAIQRIGFENLVKNCPTARKISSNPKYGELWQLPAETAFEMMHIVKVKNATAEPDGTFAEYFLRVPPWCWEVKQAIGWTFQLDQSRRYGRRRERIEYRPLVET
jgi:uncharacterized protein DUF6745